MTTPEPACRPHVNAGNETCRHTPEAFNYEVDPETECWVWLGYSDRNGYARIYNRAEKRIEWAHRYSYRLHKGEIPKRYEIDHMCENTLCVNPDHLQALTHAEHARITMKRLGKDDIHKAAAVLRETGATFAEIADALGYAGESSAHAAVLTAIRKGLIDPDRVPPVERLSDAQRADIVALVALGVPQGVVAELFDIHNSQVSRISRGLRTRNQRAAKKAA